MFLLPGAANETNHEQEKSLSLSGIVAEFSGLVQETMIILGKNFFKREYT